MKTTKSELTQERVANSKPTKEQCKQQNNFFKNLINVTEDRRKEKQGTNSTNIKQIVRSQN